MRQKRRSTFDEGWASRTSFYTPSLWFKHGKIRVAEECMNPYTLLVLEQIFVGTKIKLCEEW